MVFKQRIGPYKAKKGIGHAGNVTESEVGNRIVRAHANRLWRIRGSVRETGEPSDGVFPDSLRSFEDISDAE